MLSPIKKFSIGCLRLIIKCYKVCVSPLFGPRCRFLPTCGDYADEALKVHGPFYGTLLTVKRLLRCTFLSKQKVDPVPDKRENEV